MKPWEKAVTVAMGAALAWVFWYDVIACPACKAADQRKAWRAMERHHSLHHGGRE